MQRTEESSLAKLETVLGHQFRGKRLLTLAVTHSSLAAKRSAEAAARPDLAQDDDSIRLEDSADNEQLEFLGDAVVGLLVAESVFKRYPELQEGELTRLRARLVSRSHLGHVAGLLNLGQFMQFGKVEELSGFRKKPSLLANCLEAVVAALYLDGGLETARNFVEREVVTPYVDTLRAELERGSSIGDHKSALQEFLQARKQGQPEYVVRAESGPDHRKRFLVEVRLSEDASKSMALARGIGSTKKKAEQEAARRAFDKLRARDANGKADPEDGRPDAALAGSETP